MDSVAGLRTDEATKRLCDCLRAEIEAQSANYITPSNVWRWFALACRHNLQSPVHWLSSLLLLLMAMLLLVSYPSQQHSGR